MVEPPSISCASLVIYENFFEHAFYYAPLWNQHPLPIGSHKMSHHASTCLCQKVGSEQALAPVREPDTFAEGAWDKVPKTKGTFDLVLQHTTSHNYHKN
jgi:hypothetical protein